MQYIERTYKYCLSLLLLILLSLTTSVSADNYTISSVSDWNFYAKKMTVLTYRTSSYTLTADLDFTGQEFLPFGGFSGDFSRPVDGNSFAGVFDGNGHTIKGISKFGYTGTTGSNLGIFGVSKGEIRNLIVEGWNLDKPGPNSRSNSFGGICGYMMNGGNTVIENCAVVNSAIMGNKTPAGGIVGKMAGGTIRNCAVSGVKLSATQGSATYRGGIVGQITGEGTIEGCYADVVLDPLQSRGGGIVGQFYHLSTTGPLTIANCYATGTMRVVPQATIENIGGIIGQSAGGTTIINTGSSVKVNVTILKTTPPQRISGAVGFIANGTTAFQHVYAVGDIKFDEPGWFAGVTGINSFYGEIEEGISAVVPSTCYNVKENHEYLESNEMNLNTYHKVNGAHATLLDADFVKSGCMAGQLNGDQGLTDIADIVWIYNKDLFGGYPVPFGNNEVLLGLMLNSRIITQTQYDDFFAKLPQCGVVQTEFHIKTAADLAKYASMLAEEAADWSADKTFVVDNDIEEGVTTMLGSESKPFLGVLQGNGFSINMAISANGANAGLVAVAGKGSKINNVVTTGSVSATSCAGGVVGKALAGSAVTNCANGAAVSAGAFAGGVVGQAQGLVSGCLNVGSVSGSNNVGGIAGSATSLANCANMGYVKGEDAASSGGIAGYASAQVSFCFNGGYTVGAAIANGASAANCSFDEALAVDAASTDGSVRFDAGTLHNIQGWTATAGAYPVPAVWADTKIGQVAAKVVYFASADKANAVADSVVAATDWVCSNTAVLAFNQTSFLPVAPGVSGFVYSSDKYRREVPVTVVNPGLFGGGFGNQLSPFVITKVAHLNEMVAYVDSHNGAYAKVFELANDITDGVFTDVIGKVSSKRFAGVFRSKGGNVFNIPLNISIKRAAFPVGLVGFNRGVIERISVTGSVSASSNNTVASVGGIAGQSEGKIIACVNGAEVSAQGASNVGGISGNASGSITKCVNLGMVKGEACAAGIASVNQASSSFGVADCFNAGVVSSAKAAGVVSIAAGAAKDKPTFSNNVNAGRVEGATSASALYLVSDATPVLVGGWADAQHSLSPLPGGAQALATSALVNANIEGWTSAAGLYPHALSTQAAALAAAPVFLNAEDSAHNVKHDFAVAASSGVTWSSVNGLLKVDGGKVTRVGEGADTLVAKAGSFEKKVPVFVTCAWKIEVSDEVTEVCNMYNGVTYAAETTFAVTDTVLSALSKDCGTIRSHMVHVSVGQAGDSKTITGCGKVEFNGQTYYTDATITDADCNIVHIKVYPPAALRDSVVKLSCMQEGYSYKAGNGKLYTIKRGSKPIADSVLVVDTIKSSFCDCDSVLISVKVSIPSFVTTLVVPGEQCNTFTYTNLKGQDVELGFPFEDRNLLDPYAKAEVQHVVYNDTNFVAPDSFVEIKVVKVDIFKPVYTTDDRLNGAYCSSSPKNSYVKFDGTILTFNHERYFYNDTVFFDSLFTSASETCPTEVRKVTVRLKGIDVLQDTVFIGSHEASRCTSCQLPIVLSNVRGDEFADKGFCDFITYKLTEDQREYTLKRDTKLNLNVEASTEQPCGVTIPYFFRVNSSAVTDSLIESCEPVSYTTKTNNTFLIASDTSFADTLSGVVPGCGCDSIWKVTVKIYKPEFVETSVTACGSFSFKYLDEEKSPLLLVRDTVITDTLKNALGCDATIRTSAITIHKGYGADQTQPLLVEACDTFTYNGMGINADTSFCDTLKTIYGCDSVVKVTIRIHHPVVIDSVVHACSNFSYQKKIDGNRVTVMLGDEPDSVLLTTIRDTFVNADPHLCDTVFNLHVYSHTPRIEKPTLTRKCAAFAYTYLNGTSALIESSVTIYDTLKSKVCGCDSVVRRDSFSVGKPVYVDVKAKPDTTLFGCFLDAPLTYKRKANAWNEPREISFVPTFANDTNETFFFEVVRALNPTVVALDTATEYSDVTLRNEVHYYWIAFDTMNTVNGCDSVVPFRVEFDGKHFLGRKNIYVDHKFAPFTYNGITYEMPKYGGVKVNDSVEVVLPSRTGGCDSTFYATVRMYPCAIDTVFKKACDVAQITDLHNLQHRFVADTMFSDTLHYHIFESDTAKCDSLIRTWIVKVGRNTPASAIEPLYIGGCDFVVFTPGKKNCSVAATDTTFRKSTDFQCHYVNASGCDSLVTVYATVHKTITTEVYVNRTDFYVYVSPRDGSRIRIEKDTVINERVAKSVVVTMQNGDEFLCDSVLITNVKIRPATWDELTFAGCDSVYAVDFKDSIRGSIDDMPMKWYYKSTKFDLPNAVHSELYYHVNVQVNKSKKQSRTIKGCGRVLYNGVTYEMSDTLVERYTASNLCDSIDTVYIAVFPVVEKEDVVTGCGYLSYGGRLYTADEDIINVVKYKDCDCDSLITTTHLQIFKPQVAEEVIDSCMFLTYPKFKPQEFNLFVNDSIFLPLKADSVYTQSTDFYHYGEADENGCRTINHTILNVNPCFPYPVIVNKYNWVLALNTELLYKDVHHGAITGFQWYKNDELVLGAEQSYYTEDKLLEGCYHVHVMYGDYEVESGSICIDPSKSVVLAYDLFPQPVAVGGKVSVKCNFEAADVKAEVFNSLGVKVFSTSLNVQEGVVEELPFNFTNAGHYFLKLVTADGVVLGKKFIVK